ncbi:MAG: serine/threonine protein kinase [Aquabacterium sp.]|nr:MAG: serine/threonine protein kinase [Aquabacterium sp.]
MPPSTISDLDSLPAGTRLGEFEIECVLGVGGFGIVYRALDHALERRVAIKEYMPAALAARGADAKVSLRSASHADTFDLGLRSFINEARLLARFDHPSLVKVYRFWEANDTAYMVMPWYEGVTLREARRTMAAPPTEAWLRSLIEPLLGALAVLHREQVYHRDIAPDNILLLGDAAGEGVALPVLLDFGAARHVIGDHTQTLTAILKPSFAPIEQYAEAASLRQGPWTDLYALAAAVHFCITGRAPAPATTRAVEDELTPLVSLAAGLERDFRRVYATAFLAAIDHALAVRPQERPASVGDWWRELSASADGQHAHAQMSADGVMRTVVFDPAGRRGVDPHVAEPTAYATTAPATAPVSALALQRTVPMGSGGSGGQGAAHPAQAKAQETVAARQPGHAAVNAAAEAMRAAAARTGTERSNRWMFWALGAMVLVTIWALWQLRLARRADVPALPTAMAGTEAGKVVHSSGRAVLAAAEAKDESDARPVRVARVEESASASASQRQARVGRAAKPAASRVSAELGEPRAQCGNKVFIALALCMKRVCERAEYFPHPQCVRFREMEDANRPARP